MKHVKMFSSNDPLDLEKQLNEWFLENPLNEVLSLEHAISHVNDNIVYSVLSHYEAREKRYIGFGNCD